jgi:hypothetical protein
MNKCYQGNEAFLLQMLKSSHFRPIISQSIENISVKFSVSSHNLLLHTELE